MPGHHIEVVSPVAAFRDVDTTAARHAVRSGLAGKRALLLPAEKSSSPPFIDVLMRRMAAETDAGSIFTANPEWAFFHPSRVQSIAREVEALAGQCDVVLSGVAY